LIRHFPKALWRFSLLPTSTSCVLWRFPTTPFAASPMKLSNTHLLPANPSPESEDSAWDHISAGSLRPSPQTPRRITFLLPTHRRSS
jgi:hypothetical protein